MFEQKLLTNPTQTLQKEGLELQKGLSFQIVNTVEEANSLPDNVIPLSLENGKGVLSKEKLDNVTGGCSHDGDPSTSHTFGSDGRWNCE